jgi:methylase of polypeptide subunit release factors
LSIDREERREVRAQAPRSGKRLGRHDTGVVLDPDLARDLADRLRAADYTYDGVAARLGPEGLAGLARNSTVPSDAALDGATDQQATLIRAFALQQDVDADALRATLGPATDAPALVTLEGARARAAIELRPYDFEHAAGTHSGWLASDLTPTLDGRLARPHADFVLGLSPASITLAQLTMRAPIGSALDLGTGCGIQALHLATHAERVVATDLNPRACAMTELTAALNGVEVDVRHGSLYEPVGAEGFDLIVTNPPYVMSPPTGTRLVYREGDHTADGLMRAVVTGAPAHLNDGGALQVLGNWAITADQPWADRLAGWIEPTGCDALVLQRERLDPYEYIELWLADAGLVGTPDYARRYAEWADYFAQLGIIGVGMGWLTLYHNQRDDPSLTFEEWPHQVHQPVGGAFAAHPTAVTAARQPDAALLAATFTVAADVTQETLGRPGAADPEHIVLRRATGFGRAVEVDTGLAAVVGACDGDLPLGVLIEAVAGLLGLDSDDLAVDLLPRLRRLIEQGFLQPSSGG